MEIKERIWRNLGRLLRERGMRQVDFAQKLGRSQKTVSHWMTGTAAPEYSTLDQICRLLDVSPEELFRHPGVPPRGTAEHMAIADCILEALMARGYEIVQRRKNP